MTDKLLNKIEPYHSKITEHSKKVHLQLPFIADLHSDSLMWTSRGTLMRKLSKAHVDFYRMVEGNVALQVFSSVTQVPVELNFEKNSNRTDVFLGLAVSQRYPYAAFFSKTERAIHMSNYLKKSVEESNGKLEFITSKNQLIENRKKREQFLKENKKIDFTGSLFSIEGAHVLDGKIENVDKLYTSGVRMFGFAHFVDNLVCGSAHGTEKHGLTEFGRMVVKRVKELNMIIDLAHVSRKAFFDILELIKDTPIIVSHAGVQGTCPGVRNLDDEQIKAIAKSKGVIGVAFFKNAVCGNFEPKDIVKAISYVSKLVGIDHVSLGSDFDGAVKTRFDTSQLNLITNELLKQNFSIKDIEKIMGENVYRVFLNVLE
eukprot:gene8314-138_t